MKNETSDGQGRSGLEEGGTAEVPDPRNVEEEKNRLSTATKSGCRNITLRGLPAERQANNHCASKFGRKSGKNKRRCGRGEEGLLLTDY